MIDPSQPRSRVFLPAILSGALLYASYFPLNLGFLVWVALVPLLSLVRANARPRRIYFAAFVGGLFCYLPAIQWIRVAHPAMYGAWIGLALYCALCQVGCIAIVRRLDRRGVPIWLATPIAWVAMEYFRSHFPTGFGWLDLFGARTSVGFGWYLLGHPLHQWSPLIQIVDITGVYGLSFTVAAMNGLLYSITTHFPGLQRLWKAITEPIEVSRRARYVVGGLILGLAVYGQAQLSLHKPFAAGPSVALIQTNIQQDVKMRPDRALFDYLADLGHEATRPSAEGQRPDLVVWPETSYLDAWFDLPEGADLSTRTLEFRKRYNLSRIAISEDMRDWQTNTLLGLNAVEGGDADGRDWKFNSALLVDAKGKAVARYDKKHLVPFGEYVPMRRTFPFLQRLTPYDGEYDCKPGERWTRFPLAVGDRTYHFAAIICYEDTDDALARQYMRSSVGGVDFFVNISNDGWFNGTEEHAQHLAICRFRAIETRRSVIRAVNMGISGIIDPDGRVVALPGDTWSASVKVDGVVRGQVPIDSRDSLFVQLGDWAPVSCWLAVFLAPLYVRWRK